MKSFFCCETTLSQRDIKPLQGDYYFFRILRVSGRTSLVSHLFAVPYVVSVCMCAFARVWFVAFGFGCVLVCGCDCSFSGIQPGFGQNTCFMGLRVTVTGVSFRSSADQ